MFWTDIARFLQYFRNLSNSFINIIAILQDFNGIFSKYSLLLISFLEFYSNSKLNFPNQSHQKMINFCHLKSMFSDLSFFKVKISINNIQYHEMTNCRKSHFFYIVLTIIIYNVIIYIIFSSLLWKGQKMKVQILVSKRFGHCADPHQFNLLIWYKNI